MSLAEVCCYAISRSRFASAIFSVDRFSVLSRARMFSAGFRRVVRDANGQIMVVVDFGGFLGFGSRPIAVPVDAMVLLGQDMEIVAFTPKQREQFPTFSPLRHH